MNDEREEMYDRPETGQGAWSMKIPVMVMLGTGGDVENEEEEDDRGVMADVGDRVVGVLEYEDEEIDDGYRDGQSSSESSTPDSPSDSVSECKNEVEDELNVCARSLDEYLFHPA